MQATFVDGDFLASEVGVLGELLFQAPQFPFLLLLFGGEVIVEVNFGSF